GTTPARSARMALVRVRGPVGLCCFPRGMLFSLVQFSRRITRSSRLTAALRPTSELSRAAPRVALVGSRGGSNQSGQARGPSTGQGTISVDAVIEDEHFRKWLAKTSLQPVEQGGGGPGRLEQLYQDVVERIKEISPAKVPHLKVLRALAALFPRYFTVVASRQKLKALNLAMFGEDAPTAVARHLRVTQRLNELLGPPPEELDGLVTRLM